MNLSGRDIYRFTHGDCHFLAAALHKLDKRLEIACFFDSSNTPDIHAFVCVPLELRRGNGRYLDVNGLHTPTEILNEWIGHKRGHKLVAIKLIDWNYLRDEFSGKGMPKHGHSTYARARIVAKQLYNYYIIKR